LNTKISCQSYIVLQTNENNIKCVYKIELVANKDQNNTNLFTNIRIHKYYLDLCRQPILFHMLLSDRWWISTRVLIILINNCLITVPFVDVGLNCRFTWGTRIPETETEKYS